MIVNTRRTGCLLKGYNKSVKLQILSYFFFSVTFFLKNARLVLWAQNRGVVSCVLVMLCVTGWQIHYITTQNASLRPRHSDFLFFFLLFFRNDYVIYVLQFISVSIIALF